MGLFVMAYEVLFSADIGQSLKDTSLFHIFECGYLEERIHPNRMGAVSHTPTDGDLLRAYRVRL